MARAKTRKVRRVPTSGISSSAESSVPASEPGRGERVQAPRDGAGLLDRRDREPDGVRRDRAEQHDRHRHQHEHAEQRADERAGGDRVERLHAEVEQRVGRERHQREQSGGGEGQQAETAHVRVAVGQPPAEPVADRQRDEHDPDRVRPHDRGGAEVGGEQPHRRDLRAERARPHHEDEQRQRRHLGRRLARDAGPARGPCTRWRSTVRRRTRPPRRRPASGTRTSARARRGRCADGCAGPPPHGSAG